MEGKGSAAEMPEQWEKWPSNLPLEQQVERLAQVLMEDYPHTFDRSEGAIEKAARLLWYYADPLRRQTALVNNE